jgi:transcription elongation factor Elf1
MGEANRKKGAVALAERVSLYAVRCNVDQAHAVHRLAALDKADIQYRKAERCPKCGKYELVTDSTDYEYTNNEEWVWCSECGFTDDITKRYEPLLNWAQFYTVAAEADMFRAGGFPDD